MNIKTLIKNSFFILLTNIISIVSGIYLSVLVARSLGPESFGTLSFILGFTGLFLFACDWGIGLLIMNRVAAERAAVKEYIDNAILPVLFLSTIIFVIIYALMSLLNYPPVVLKGFAIGLIILAISALTGLFRGAFYAYEKMEYETVVNLSERLIAIATVSIAVLYNGGLLIILSAYLIAKLLSNAVCISLYQKRLAKINPRFDVDYTLSLLKNALPFGLNVMLSALYIQTDISLISFIKGDHDVGLYRVANGLILNLPIIALMVNNSIYPVMVSRNEDKGFIKRACEQSIRLVLLIGLPITMFIFIFSDRIISTLYGKDYAAAAIVLMILAMAIPLKLASNSLATTLTSINRQMERTKVLAIAGAFSIIVNILLISKFGYLGAGITAVLTELVIFFLLLASIRRFFAIAGLFQPFIVGIPLGASLLLLRKFSEALVLVAVLIYSSYCLYQILEYYSRTRWKTLRSDI